MQSLLHQCSYSDAFMEFPGFSAWDRSPGAAEPAGSQSRDLSSTSVKQHGVDPERLAHPGRQRTTAKLRALIAHLVVEHRIATMNELARHFGRSLSTLSESLELPRRRDPAFFEQPLVLK